MTKEDLTKSSVIHCPTLSSLANDLDASKRVYFYKLDNLSGLSHVSSLLKTVQERSLDFDYGMLIDN